MAHNNIICYLPRKCLVSLIQISMNVQNIIIIIIELDLLIICTGQQHEHDMQHTNKWGSNSSWVRGGGGGASQATACWISTFPHFHFPAVALLSS